MKVAGCVIAGLLVGSWGGYRVALLHDDGWALIPPLGLIGAVIGAIAGAIVGRIAF